MTLPIEWVERLIIRFSEIYGEYFNKKINDKYFLIIYKILLANGLDGLTADELRNGLNCCKKYYPYSVPTVIEFWHYAKNIKYIKVGKNNGKQTFENGIQINRNFNKI